MEYGPEYIEKEPFTSLSSLGIKRSTDFNWSEAETAAQCLSALYLSEHLSDISFTFSAYQDIRLPAHKFVLSMRSPVFEAMFYGTISERGKTVAIQDIEPEVMKTILKYLYADKTEINGDNVLPCLYTAEKYNLSGLVKQCSEFLEINIDITNVSQIHEHAVFYEMKPLQEKCLAVITKNATSIISSPIFLSFSQATLLIVLKSEQLERDEIDVFTAAMKWAERKCEVNNKPKTGQNMRNQLEEAVFQIRFPIIPIEKFAQVVVPSGILTKEELLMVYKYNATKGSTPLGRFRHEHRARVHFIADLSFHNNTSQYQRASNDSYLLQVNCTSFSEDAEQVRELQADGITVDDEGFTFKINRSSLMLKSITGMFVTGVKMIICNGKKIKDYKVTDNDIIFESPIEMFDGNIVQFFKNNRSTYHKKLSSFGKNSESENSNIKQYKCTITQIPNNTETISFLK